jgi:hypothetical protein
MVLPLYQRYETVFLSHDSLGPKLSHTSVAKVIHYSVAPVKHWLKRCKDSKDLTDSSRSVRPRITTAK